MSEFELALSFDDVLMVPKKSDIVSRSEVDLTSKISNIDFRLPIISSPMDTVTETQMASTMADHGGLGIIHRYNTIEEQCSLIKGAGFRTVAAAIGVSGDFEERACALYDAGATVICIDVAHGHHTLTKEALEKVRSIFGVAIQIIAGNVATLEAFNDLADWGADAIRVGIGGGSICSTRIMTGHGVPTFQSILDCSRSDRDATIIADGGIKTAGDIVKSLAAGADFVMLGSMLAGTEESPGDVLKDNTGNKFKVYRGMASREAQVAWRGAARSLEGVSTTVPFKGPVSTILESLSQNVRSGLSYSGTRTIREIQTSVKFIRQSSAGLAESYTHILNR